MSAFQNASETWSFADKWVHARNESQACILGACIISPSLVGPSRFEQERESSASCSVPTPGWALLGFAVVRPPSLSWPLSSQRLLGLAQLCPLCRLFHVGGPQTFLFRMRAHLPTHELNYSLNIDSTHISMTAQCSHSNLASTGMSQSLSNTVHRELRLFILNPDSARAPLPLALPSWTWESTSAPLSPPSHSLHPTKCPFHSLLPLTCSRIHLLLTISTSSFSYSASVDPNWSPLPQRYFTKEAECFFKKEHLTVPLPWFSGFTILLG